MNIMGTDRKKMRMLARLMPALFLFCALPGTAAKAMRPADFDYAEAKQRIDKRIKFPDFKGDITVVMGCVSRVKASGKMTDTGCYLKNNYDEPFADAVANAAKKARMNPALIGGKPREIFLQFRVAFVRKGEAQEIRFVPNPGYEENTKAYGQQHVAGQRAIGRNEPWKDACPKRAHYSVWVLAYLGEDGHADSPSIEHADGIMPTPTCLDAIRQTIIDSSYTPALADGEPVPSTYIEPFSN